MEKVRDRSKEMPKSIAKSMVKKFPESFADRINNLIIGDGSEMFATQLYDKVNSDKKICDKSPIKKRQSEFQEDNFSYGVLESEY